MNHRRLLWPALSLVFIAAFIAAVYSRLLHRSGFGPEYAYFYHLAANISFADVWSHYTTIKPGAWYRPTAFYLPYWIGTRFLSWHDVDAWRIVDICNVIAVAWLVYKLVLLLFPNRRLAGVIAAVYFATHPALYLVVFEVSAFDFLYIFFVTASVLAYLLALRDGGKNSIGWTFLSWFFFLVALTCKEIAVVTPVYLGFVSLVFLFSEKGKRLQRTDLARECLRLAPFGALLLLYWWFYIRTIAPSTYPSGGDYRIEPNALLIVQNLLKYPLWMIRQWGNPWDRMMQAAVFDNARNNWISGIVFLLVLTQWVKTIRSKTIPWTPIVLSLGWMAIFAIVPVFSGGYLWHSNLAMIGYAVLFGVAAAQIVDWKPSLLWRGSATGVFFLGLLLLNWVNIEEYIAKGPHETSYRLTEKLLVSPPVPRDRVAADSLIFVEDSREFGRWYYGGADHLFTFIYLIPHLEEKSVPPMPRVPNKLRRMWMARKNAYFFRYDNNFNWRDGSADFRADSAAKLANLDSEPSPILTRLMPSSTAPGQVFNKQPDGSAAIAVMGDHFHQGAVIMFGSTPLATAYGGEHSLSATVRPELFQSPGKYPVYIIDNERESERLDFVVQ